MKKVKYLSVLIVAVLCSTIAFGQREQGPEENEQENYELEAHQQRHDERRHHAHGEKERRHHKHDDKYRQHPHEQKQGRPTKEKIKALKIAHITSELNLSAEEAQKFWPVYNELEAKMDAFHAKKKATRKKGKEEGEMSDAELEKLLNQRFADKQAELDLRKEYYAKFKAVIPIKKVAKLYKAEHSFKKDLLKKMRVKKGGPNELNIPPPPRK